MVVLILVSLILKIKVHCNRAMWFRYTKKGFQIHHLDAVSFEIFRYLCVSFRARSLNTKELSV